MPPCRRRKGRPLPLSFLPHTLLLLCFLLQQEPGLSFLFPNPLLHCHRHQATHITAAAARPTSTSTTTATTSISLTPAQRIQHAVQPEEILQAAVQELAHLKSAHLSASILRLGKGLLQPKETKRRQQLLLTNYHHHQEEKNENDSSFQVLLDKTLRLITQQQSAVHLGHVHDTLLGLALLDYPFTPTERELVQSSIYHGLLTERFHELTPGDVSSLVWCWRKLGFDPEKMPAAMAVAEAAVPFRVLIGALATDTNEKGNAEEGGLLDIQALISEVDLKRDTIQLTPSKTIVESRLTAWQGPKPFYYSGKEMAAQPMTPRIAQIRDKLFEMTGVYYDCVLINFYEDGKTGMRFHIDPDQGVYWSSNTVVVSVGDTREFCLREVVSSSSFSDSAGGGDGEGGGGKRRKEQGAATTSTSTTSTKVPTSTERHRFFVRQSDAVEMTRNCQWRYQHCVKVCENAADAGMRVSLVYKQSLELATAEEQKALAELLLAMEVK